MMTKMSLPTTIRTYSELSAIRGFMNRYEYLRLDGRVGEETFGFDRYINQKFYHSDEWRSIRDYIITRDLGCDLGVEGFTIHGRIYIHHMNPITVRDIRDYTDYLTNPEYLICTTHNTHNAIHYGDSSLLITEPVERTPYDTCPWRKNERRKI